MHKLASEVDCARTERVNGKPCVPVVAMFDIGFCGHNCLARPGCDIEIIKVSTLGYTIASQRILRVRLDVKAIAASDTDPVILKNGPFGQGISRAAPGAVILKPAVNIVGSLHVVTHMIELAEGQVFHEPPAFASVIADDDPAVIPDNHRLTRRVNPHRVIIRMGLLEHGKRRECFSSILADSELGGKKVEDVIIDRVDPNSAVIERPVVDVLIAVDSRPVESAVRGAEKNIFLGFDQGIDNLGIIGRKGNPDAAELAFGQPVFLSELLPVSAGVSRYVQAASRPAGLEKPGPAPVLPESGDNFIRVPRVDGHVGHSGLFIHVENFLPGSSAVRSPEDTSLLTVSPGCSEGSDISHVRVFWMEKDF